MKRKVKIVNHMFEQLKDEITTKEVALDKERQEFQRVEREREHLKVTYFILYCHLSLAILVLYTFRSNITMHSQHPHKAWWDTFPMKHVLMHSFVFFIQWDSTGELNSAMCRNRNHAIMFFQLWYITIKYYTKIIKKYIYIYIRRVQMQTFSPKISIYYQAPMFRFNNFTLMAIYRSFLFN